jgi:hypothetical protein
MNLKVSDDDVYFNILLKNNYYPHKKNESIKEA